MCIILAKMDEPSTSKGRKRKFNLRDRPKYTEKKKKLTESALKLEALKIMRGDEID